MPPITPKAGDILFAWGRDWISDAIEFITDGPSHVCLIVDDATICEAQTGRPIGERPISFYTGQADRLELWRDETLTDVERVQMIEYARSLYGRPYDYALIPIEFAHFVAGVPIGWYHESNGRICSTFVCDVAAAVGRKWADTENPAPVDARTKKLTLLYVWEDGRWITNMENA